MSNGGDAEVPVLIAGGGLIGLSTAMFLAQHGIRSLAVERLKTGSLLPRAGHFHLRTIELFRSTGIEEEVRRRSGGFRPGRRNRRHGQSVREEARRHHPRPQRRR